MENDETMSLEQAFATGNTEHLNTFNFEGDEAKKENNATNNSSSPVGNEEEEQKVPYSRFKRKTDEYTSRIQELEEELEEANTSRNSRTKNESLETPPDAWLKLYGNNDTSREAWLVQLDLQNQLEERTYRNLQQREIDNQNALVENEGILNDNLDNLGESLGRKLTPKQEEDILTIVDKYSPVGRDGKYLGGYPSFPFEQAYEIYSNEQSQKGRSTFNARSEVNNLTSNSSSGESNEAAPFKRGWDSWREAL